MSHTVGVKENIATDPSICFRFQWGTGRFPPCSSRYPRPWSKLLAPAVPWHTVHYEWKAVESRYNFKYWPIIPWVESEALRIRRRIQSIILRLSSHLEDHRIYIYICIGFLKMFHPSTTAMTLICNMPVHLKTMRVCHHLVMVAAAAGFKVRCAVNPHCASQTGFLADREMLFGAFLTREWLGWWQKTVRARAIGSWDS